MVQMMRQVFRHDRIHVVLKQKLDGSFSGFSA
jgi:hypothetical protein